MLRIHAPEKTPAAETPAPRASRQGPAARARAHAWAACALVAIVCTSPAAAGSMRFHGNGVGDIDRVKIRIDDPSSGTDPGPPVDVGATDFTIEFWVRGTLSDNAAPAITCGTTNAWIFGNIVIDRDRFNQGRNYGLSFGAGRLAFGVMDAAGNARTICSGSVVLDGAWHHVAVQRRAADGWMQILVDGTLEAQADGPDGDISYPDDGVPCSNCCGGPCLASDPFIVIAAEKHDAGPEFPSFSGWLDELRFSTTLRHAGGGAPPTAPFVPDGQTAALYHFDEGAGDTLFDVSEAPGGPSHGERRFGGAPAGPEWSSDTPFATLSTQPVPPAAARLHALPNPARGRVTFSLTSATADRALEIVDVQGRVVALLAADAPGRWVLSSDGRLLPTGVYTARLKLGNRWLNRRFVLIP